MKDIREDIQVFGGVSCSDDITSDDSCVFTKAYGFSETSIVIVFYGGEDFHVDSIKVTGWKPLGREFHVTKSQGSLLQELDGIPAYDVYRKYLNINNDENFFYNAKLRGGTFRNSKIHLNRLYPGIFFVSSTICAVISSTDCFAISYWKISNLVVSKAGLNFR